jgi:hypothetical protein
MLMVSAKAAAPLVEGDANRFIESFRQGEGP